MKRACIARPFFIVKKPLPHRAAAEVFSTGNYSRVEKCLMVRTI